MQHPSRCLGAAANVGDDLEEPVDIGGLEERVGPLRADVGERRLVEPARLDDAVLGELVDDEVHELDLVGGIALVVKELGERILGGGAVETDKPADEQAEASGLRFCSLAVGPTSDTTVDEHAL